MTIGELHLGDALQGPVFGPALVKAYEIESKKVVYPRIALEEDVLDRLHGDPTMRREGHTLEQELEYFDVLLARDPSGLWYIDYLRAAEPECDDYCEYMLFLKSHKTLVKEGLESSKRNLKVSQKYEWLRNYHNERVRAEAEKFDPYAWDEDCECFVHDVLESLLLTKDG